MPNLIVPKTHIKAIEAPLIFLAGPIRSAPNWHEKAIEFMLDLREQLVIASPRIISSKKFSGQLLIGVTEFHHQRAWERYYLDLASKTGAILFWLPGEEAHDCAKAYGAMTRLEIGQWMANYRNDNSIRMCIGGDGKFSEFDTIRYDLSLDAPDKKIFSTLEETCTEAIKLALRK